MVPGACVLLSGRASPGKVWTFLDPAGGELIRASVEKNGSHLFLIGSGIAQAQKQDAYDRMCL